MPPMCWRVVAVANKRTHACRYVDHCLVPGFRRGFFRHVNRGVMILMVGLPAENEVAEKSFRRRVVLTVEVTYNSYTTTERVTRVRHDRRIGCRN